MDKYQYKLSTESKYWILNCLMLALICMLISASAHAGTYNFYFNNAEQGDNSTAAPNITVTDKKDKDDKSTDKKKDQSSDEEPAIESENLDDQGLPTLGPAQDSKPVKPVGPVAMEQNHGPFLRFTGTLFGAQTETTSTRYNNYWGSFDSQPSSYTYKTKSYPVGFMVSGSLFLNEYFAGTLFLGGLLTGMSGIEVEAAPFGMSNTVNLGLLLGYTEGGILFFNSGAPHLGARVSVAFNDRLGLTLAARGSPFGGDNFSFLMAESGLYVKF